MADPRMLSRPSDPGHVSADAWERAQAWAHGQLSHWNICAGAMENDRAMEVAAVMDAQEVVKWSALAVAAAELERLRHAAF